VAWRGLGTVSSHARRPRSPFKELVANLEAIPLPESEQGQDVKQQLERLSTDLTNSVDAIKAAAAEISDDASAAATIAFAAVTVGLQVRNLVKTAESAIDSLKGSSFELARAFARAQACRDLGS